MYALASRKVSAVICSTLLCGCLSVAVLQGTEGQSKERLLHVADSILLLGYPDDDAIFVADRGEELTLQAPGPNRGGHHTYPSLSRDGTLVATSYVKSPYPHYHEGIATYSLITKRWQQYDSGDFDFVWAMTLSPDGSTLAFKAQRQSEPQLVLNPQIELLLLNLHSGDLKVLLESYPASAPLSWSPDGRYVVYEHLLSAHQNEIRILDLLTGQERTLVSGGSDPAWSPSGEWIAYLEDAGAVAMVHPDGTGRTTLVSLRRSLPWFSKRSFMYPPVWSPDSKALLLNEAAADETARASIHQFDLGTRTLRKKQGRGVAVLAWTRCCDARLCREKPAAELFSACRRG